MTKVYIASKEILGLWRTYNCLRNILAARPAWMPFSLNFEHKVQVNSAHCIWSREHSLCFEKISDQTVTKMQQIERYLLWCGMTSVNFGFGKDIHSWHISLHLHSSCTFSCVMRKGFCLTLVKLFLDFRFRLWFRLCSCHCVPDVTPKSWQSRNMSGTCVQLIEIALIVVEIYMLTPHWDLPGL